MGRLLKDRSFKAALVWRGCIRRPRGWAPTPEPHKARAQASLIPHTLGKLYGFAVCLSGN